MQMNWMARFAWAAMSAGCLLLSAAPGPPTAVTLHIDSERPGGETPADFAGLSFEMETLLPRHGSYYFSPSNAALLQTFRNLGIRNLRIGGNTADRPTVPFPDLADVDSAFGFAKAAGAQVIFTFRLRVGGPRDAAPIARRVMERYASTILCFAIGNEPDIYSKTYAAYRDELKSYMAAFAEAGVGAGAKFCGPGTTPSEPEWAREFAHDFGSSGRIRFVTQHAYPGASGRQVADAASGRRAMLSSEWVKSYEAFYQSFAPAAEMNRVPYRIEETNNYFHGGAKDVSDTFASALWGLDYLHWWAIHGAAGVNFHTGDEVAAADETTTCYYAVFRTSGNSYAVQPLGYAMKAFELGGHGRTIPVRSTPEAPALDLRSYGVRASNQDLFVTVINKEHGPDGRDAMVTFVPDGEYAHAEMMRLEAPAGNVAAKAGVTLGGAAIQENAVWTGKWKAAERRENGRVVTAIPAGSAAILKFSKAAK
jgi:hypothetical protein